MVLRWGDIMKSYVVFLMMLLMALFVVGIPVVAQLQLESTFYYDGNIDDGRWRNATIDVDADGTIAVAVTGTVGAGNEPGKHRARVLLYDKDGTPIADIPGASNTGMANITFGPDGMIYTSESWFGAGTHIYDRPGGKNRFIAKRSLRADGAHVDRGIPTDVAVTKDLNVYTVLNQKISLLSQDDKLITQFPWAGHLRIDVGADGLLYSGNKVLAANNEWKSFKYFVTDIAPGGKMLVRDPGGWAIYNPATDTLEVKGKYPPNFNMTDAALGPDGRVFVTTNNDQGLAFAAINTEGKILFQRGADFDRLKVILPDNKYIAGKPVVFSAEIIRSRDLGMVPADRILPADNRANLALTASVTPAVYDPLGKRVWKNITLEPATPGKYSMTFPADLTGLVTLKLSTTATEMPGSKPLTILQDVTVSQPGEIAYLQPLTDRGRTAFSPGKPVRLTVFIKPVADVDLSPVRLVLKLQNNIIWSASLGIKKMLQFARKTAVVSIPPEVTARLKPGVYSAELTNLPPGISGGMAVVAIIDPVHPEAFQTPAHTIGSTFKDPLLDSQLVAEWGATHITASAQYDPKYIDILSRLGVDFNYQIYGHYSAVHTLPQEQGAAQVWASEWAQKLDSYPAFKGITYHDLQVQAWGGWWDTPRKPYYDNELWPKWAAEVDVPATIAVDAQKKWSTAKAVEGMLTRLYGKLNSAISHANSRLMRTTMQWWHQPLYIADPDDVAKGQTIITAQHMEEQYYHPLTVANMTDLWKRPDKDIWVYGNASWQEDGTGALQYTDIMAALFRGAQGVGRNEAPTAGEEKAEYGTRAATPLFKLLHKYGGLSAIAHPTDQLVVWRSMYQECSEYPGRPSEKMHMSNITAAYTACLYGHHTAGIITDDLVRGGGLKRYKAVIISFENPLPADLLKPLQDFQKSGGIVLANKPANGYWAPTGAIELGSAFTGSSALAHANRDSLRHIGIEEEGLKGAAIIEKALSGKLERFVDCDEPAVWLSVLESGAARYIWAVNVKRLPQNPMDLHRYSGYENTRLPVKTMLRIPPGKYVIYDVFSGKKIKPVEKNGKWLIPADMSVFPGRILALLPDEIGNVKLYGVEAKPADDAWALSLRVQVTNVKKQVMNAAIPVEIIVTDAAGNERYHIYRTAINGECNVKLPVAANDTAGKWSISARELLSGQSITADMAITTPFLPTATPLTTQVEWQNADRVVASLKKATKIAIVTQVGNDTEKAINALTQQLQGQNKQVTRLTSPEYLDDLKTLHWKGFPDKHGVEGDFGKIIAREPKYDLVITLEIPGNLTGVVKPETLPIVFSASDPGEGRGLIQYAATPVYNDEDVISLYGGDVDGLLAAINALSTPPVINNVVPTLVKENILTGKPGISIPSGLQEFIGLEINELAVSADGQRIAAGLRGWGNNLFVLDSKGKILNKDVAGKYFPVALNRIGNSFSVISHENDPTTMYLKIYDNSGKAIKRFAAMGRRIGGLRDCTPNYPAIMRERFMPQSAFSMTEDMSLVAVAGSNGIAVWDNKTEKLLWRDDDAHYKSPQIDASSWPDTPSFPQIHLSDDGKWLILQHGGKVIVRDARTGAVIQELKMPPGTEGGRIQIFDGKQLVVGNQDYFGFTIGNGGAVQAQWHFKAPKTVTASVFNKDGLRYAVGEVNGTLRIMQGGGQTGGYISPGPGGAIASMDALPDFSRIAFSTTTGYIGILDNTGTLLWQKQVSGPAIIRFIGNDGAVVVGDRRGYIRWFNASSKETRNINLTDNVWRDDITRILTTPDTTPTLSIGPSPSESQVIAIPANADNLAKSAKFNYITGRSWWNERISPDRSVPLNDGKTDAPAGGWFNRTNLEYLSFVPGPAAWEIVWDKPIMMDTLVGYEANKNAVPQEIRIEAWLDNNWQEVAHTYWNNRDTHVHRFKAVTTTKLRYTPIGDLANGVYTSEIEVYNSEGK